MELASTDPGQAREFYAALFGWEVAGGRFRLDGHAVAGLTTAGEGRPAGWLTYLAVPDLEDALEQVASAGGRCVTWPAERHGGRCAIVADRGGAAIGLWESGDFAGAQAAGEPNTMAWPELVTDDPRGAADFYGRAFGWLLREQYGSGEWLTPARDAVAGLVSGGRPARWRAAVQVADCSAAAEACLRLGGRIVTGPAPMSLGSYAELADPYGAAFAVAAPTQLPVDAFALDTLVGMEVTFPG
jgi:predicted enzyme related to lactoylglutathione lyase